jgi:hypothetical protein
MTEAGLEEYASFVLVVEVNKKLCFTSYTWVQTRNDNSHDSLVYLYIHLFVVYLTTLSQ